MGTVTFAAGCVRRKGWSAGRGLVADLLFDRILCCSERGLFDVVRQRLVADDLDLDVALGEMDAVLLELVADALIGVAADGPLFARTGHEFHADDHVEFFHAAHALELERFEEAVAVIGIRAEFLVDLPEQQRQALLASGALQAHGADVATPGWGFAQRIRSVLRQCPKPADSGELPAARLAYLAERSRRVAHRSPPSSVQWTLFGLSVLLFVGLGWLFWDLQFAALLLIVIAFHESGHFLAMRAFGYRNVHMLMLPLIGGVAMGHDAQPDSWRRAWMSLMGPLPGILLGWALMLLLWQQPDGGDSWLWTLGWLLLFVNYLNILPVPPLDGSHVVQSLLPHRLA